MGRLCDYRLRASRQIFLESYYRLAEFRMGGSLGDGHTLQVTGRIAGLKPQDPYDHCLVLESFLSQDPNGPVFDSKALLCMVPGKPADVPACYERNRQGVGAAPWCGQPDFLQGIAEARKQDVRHLWLAFLVSPVVRLYL